MYALYNEFLQRQKQVNIYSTYIYAFTHKKKNNNQYIYMSGSNQLASKVKINGNGVKEDGKGC